MTIPAQQTATLECNGCEKRQTFTGTTPSQIRVAARAAGWRVISGIAFCSAEHQLVAAQPRRLNRKLHRKYGAPKPPPKTA